MDLESVKACLKRQVHYGDFELHAGSLTDYYIDVRPLLLDSTIAYDVAILLLSKIDSTVSVIAGVEKSGFIIIPSVITVCYHRHLKGVLIRKDVKKYGLCQMIEGDFVAAGSKIAIIDDIISTGSSLLFATRAVEKKFKAKVVQWITLVDRTEGRVKTPVPLTSVFTAEEILAG